LSKALRPPVLEDRSYHFSRAEELAREALRVEPGSVEGQHILAAALGLRIDHVGTREKIRLANEVGMPAKERLERDPAHAGAHPLLGRFYAGTMRMGCGTHLLAQRILGGNQLAGMSWEAAEMHLRRAGVEGPLLACALPQSDLRSPTGFAPAALELGS
jgi:hypothetical protein